MTTTPKPGEPAAEPAAAAAAPPASVDQEAEHDRLFKEFAAKHVDPTGSGAISAAQDDDPEATPEPEADTGAPAAPAEVPGAKVETETPPKTPDPAPVAAAPEGAGTSAAPAPPAADDIWAKASVDPRSKELKAAWDAAPAAVRPAIEAAQRRLLLNGQEIAQLRSANSRRTTRTPAAAPAPAATKVDETSELFKDPAWIKAKEEYPDALAAVEGLLGKALGSVTKQVDGKLAPLQAASDAHAGVVEEIELKEQKNLLHRMHSDYSDVLSSDGFRAAFDQWIDTQPDAIKQMVVNNSEYVKNANEASTVFRLFKADTGFGAKAAAPPPPPPAETGNNPPAAAGGNPSTPPANSRRSRQLDASSAVNSRGAGVSATPDKDDEDYWFKHWSKKHADPEARPN